MKIRLLRLVWLITFSIAYHITKPTPKDVGAQSQSSAAATSYSNKTWSEHYNLTNGVNWDVFRDVCWGQSKITQQTKLDPHSLDVCPNHNANYGRELEATHMHIGKPTSGTGAIVILAQNKPHLIHGRDSKGGLLRTIDLFYKHYNEREKDDLIILHEGDFDNKTQQEVINGRKEISFFQLKGENWEVWPPSVRKDNRASWRGDAPDGYRHMIRWYFVRIWPTMKSLGYKWVMRIDDDSYILSPIPYNIFGFMEYFGVDYAYRNIARESGWDGNNFYYFTRDFVKQQNGAKHGWLLDTCRTKDLDAYTKENCGEIYGFYNNFFVGNVDRWMEPDMQIFLKHVDDSGKMYTSRWNDLTLQSLAAMLFIKKSKVHHFVGWGYGHNSGPQTQLGWGVFQIGCNENNQKEALKNALSKFVGWKHGELYNDGNLVNINGQITLSGEKTRLVSWTLPSIC